MGETYKIPKAEEVDFESLQREAREKKASDNETRQFMEKSELEGLIDRGVEYTITYTHRFLCFKRIKRRTFTIYEPTLAVLDELSREAIDIAIDENMDKGGADTIRASMKAVKDNATSMARIVAIATLGEEIFDTTPGGRHRFNRARVGRFADLVKHTCKPSQLPQLYTAVLRQSNIGSFISSTRLMGALAKRTALVE